MIDFAGLVVTVFVLLGLFIGVVVGLCVEAAGGPVLKAWAWTWGIWFVAIPSLVISWVKFHEYQRTRESAAALSIYAQLCSNEAKAEVFKTVKNVGQIAVTLTDAPRGRSEGFFFGTAPAVALQLQESDHSRDYRSVISFASNERVRFHVKVRGISYTRNKQGFDIDGSHVEIWDTSSNELMAWKRDFFNPSTGKNCAGEPFGSASAVFVRAVLMPSLNVSAPKPFP